MFYRFLQGRAEKGGRFKCLVERRAQEDKLKWSQRFLIFIDRLSYNTKSYEYRKVTISLQKQEAEVKG
jgi:hypothetical protein